MTIDQLVAIHPGRTAAELAQLYGRLSSKSFYCQLHNARAKGLVRAEDTGRRSRVYHPADGVPDAPVQRWVYPFAALAVGQEFTCSRDMGRRADLSCRRKVSVAAAARQYARKHGGTFLVRVRDANTIYCKRTS